jgi:signal transduction histidine kinase/FixJ family two-component response regulator
MTQSTPALRVLYLEDNPVDADLTRRELARLAPEMRLEIVTTLGAALQRLVPACPPFDVVLADLSLPDGSGLELLAYVRERELPLAVVIITGSGDQESAVAALKAGADDYLVKRPEQVSNLPRVLSAAFASYQQNRERRARPLRVLYCEPTALDIDLTRRYLAQHAPHIHLMVIGSGEEVLARLPQTAAGTAPAFDVLLLDYRLPGLNALEVVKTVRQERGLDFPIVLVTGQGNEEVAVRALRLGVDDYLVKHEGYLHRLPAVLEKVQKQAELNLSVRKFRSLSQEFNGLLDAIPDSLMLLDLELKVLWANRAAADSIGAETEALVGRHCYDLWCQHTTPCEACPVLQCFESGSPRDETVTKPDGRTWDIRTVPLMDEQGRVAKVIELKRDISEQRKLEMMYLHAQKMESIGTLAGGVAHDFNNILTVIAGLGQLTLMNMAEGDPYRGNIGGILEAAERATHLTKELLLFSRRQDGERRPVDLNGVICKMDKFLRRIIGEEIVLKTEHYGAPLPILADSNHLGQVLMNLAVNARDAMPKGGKFIVQTERLLLDKEFVAANGYGEPGPYALLAVSDTGTGMDKETQQRIFEPFFSTKEVGKGTGLGLAVVYGIVNQHDGFITVCSEPGQGTTFRIYLPLTSEAARQEAETEQGQPVVGGTETILLAEDDDLVRALMESVLTEAGYRVIAAADGEEAVRKFGESAGSIQLLIFDLIMPRMNGKEASDKIRKIQPGIKTIFASGYAPDIAEQKAALDGGNYLINKPVSPHELLKKLRNVLDGTPP